MTPCDCGALPISEALANLLRATDYTRRIYCGAPFSLLVVFGKEQLVPSPYFMHADAIVHGVVPALSLNVVSAGRRELDQHYWLTRSARGSPEAQSPPAKSV